MNRLLSGQRLAVDSAAPIVLRFAGREAHRVAVAAITAEGRAIGFNPQGDGTWQLAAIGEVGSKAEIVAYITDDTSGGFVTAAYLLVITIGTSSYEAPLPEQQLAAVIIGELYTRDGSLRLKVSNEGYTFGIDAYVRARQLGSIDIPHRRRPASPDARSWPDDHGSPSGRSPGGMLGSGSGVIIGPDLVVTNAHVVEDGTAFQLGQSKALCQLLAADPFHDLALLQVKTTGSPLPLRVTSPLWLGEAVMAAGYPLMDVLGADLKVTTGNVSGLTGSRGDVSRFQFTAPIGSGSSGGAIVDEAGNLVGITAASLAHENFRERGSLSENVNFAVRASLVFELAAAAGVALPETAARSGGDRRQVVNHLRSAVVSILVMG